MSGRVVKYTKRNSHNALVFSILQKAFSSAGTIITLTESKPASKIANRFRICKLYTLHIK